MLGATMDEHDSAQPVPSGADPTGPIELELELELDVAVSRERAWDAYVHGMTEWWHPGWTRSGTGLDRIDVEPHPGGRVIEHTRDGVEHVWGAVTDAVPGERFGHTFHLSHEGEPSRVTVTFEDLPHGGTRVRFAHSGWNASDEGARVKRTDWPLLLERYRAYAQHV